MLQQAIAWGSSYIEGALFSYQGCCCSADQRPDGQGNAKCADLVVMSEWDVDERARGTIGYTGHFNGAAPSHSAEAAHVRAAAGAPGAETSGGAASSAAASPSSSRAATRDPRDGGLPQTPRAAASTSRASCESSPLGCGPPSGRDPDEGSSVAAARETLALRELMKRFVQDMVHGRQLAVVIGEGRTEPSKLTLTPNLMCLQLEASGVTHDIPLRNVKDVCPGKLQSSKLVPIELDDLCDTLVLRNNECVTFRLGSIKERDEFSKCLKVLALALDQ